MKNNHSSLKPTSFLRSSRGSFTIESTFVFPIIMLCVVMILLLCLYLYQSAMLVQASAITSERAAYSWNNSHKDPSTGSFAEEGETEDLYWRLTEDQLVSALFGGFSEGGASQTINVPDGGGESLGAIKMANAAKPLPAGVSGTMTSKRGILHPITTVLYTPLNLVPIQRFAGDQMGGSQYSTVVEPVEFIRNVELVRYYVGKFKADKAKPSEEKGGEAVAMTPQNAGVQLSKVAKKK
ncbi:TadE/TadG family type IV pilus assembly protein [Saccharibacillus sp. JS10]|uniref:TadE/TadG family type IV pilus assembly protein n=1 Tax=Saccharibacillus sp. JS10 TaxID=2950552 RepID=UPI00210CC310|nr:TadE family protein [Saccharibacillus sp. JS10]MCQ4086755.1 pilus assembly protein [Saccharibacillus sp. JS10]